MLFVILLVLQLKASQEEVILKICNMLVIEAIDSVVRPRQSVMDTTIEGKEGPAICHPANRWIFSELRKVQSISRRNLSKASVLLKSGISNVLPGNQYKKYLCGVLSQAHIVPDCSWQEEHCFNPRRQKWVQADYWFSCLYPLADDKVASLAVSFDCNLQLFVLCWNV